jgi:hypothetical protein
MRAISVSIAAFLSLTGDVVCVDFFAAALFADPLSKSFYTYII